MRPKGTKEKKVPSQYSFVHENSIHLISIQTTMISSQCLGSVRDCGWWKTTRTPAQPAQHLSEAQPSRPTGISSSRSPKQARTTRLGSSMLRRKPHPPECSLRQWNRLQWGLLFLNYPSLDRRLLRRPCTPTQMSSRSRIRQRSTLQHQRREWKLMWPAIYHEHNKKTKVD